MSRETLEDWILEITDEANLDKLMTKYGVYNDLFFYFNPSNQQRNEFINLLKENELFTHRRSESQELNHYKTDLVDLECFSIEGNNHIRFEFPNKGIIFSPNTLPVKDKEINYKYSSSMQLSLFGDKRTTVKALSIITNEFILPNKVPIYVSTVNCKDKKFQRFSAFIND